MSVTQPIMTDERPDRREVFAAINAGLDAGLPAPMDVRLIPANSNGPACAGIDLESRADLEQWRAWFGMQDRHITTDLYSDRICSRVWEKWRGWHLGLNARDAIAVAD
jgi:hypothetical protein